MVKSTRVKPESEKVEQDVLSSLNSTLKITAAATKDVLVGKKSWFGGGKKQKRYRQARERWGRDEASVFDSPLKEAKRLLKELAISLEASKDKKRVEVVREVLELLASPDLHAMNDRMNLQHNDEVKHDATMMEWFGNLNPFTHGFGASQSSPNKQASFRGLRADDDEEVPATPIAPLITERLLPEAEGKVALMLESGLDSWAWPEFSAIELHRLTGDNQSHARCSRPIQCSVHAVLSARLKVLHRVCAAGDNGLVALGWALSHRHNWASSLGLKPSTYVRLLHDIQEGYNPVAYHNAAHACDVTHGVHWLLSANPDGGLKGACSHARRSSRS